MKAYEILLDSPRAAYGIWRFSDTGIGDFLRSNKYFDEILRELKLSPREIIASFTELPPVGGWVSLQLDHYIVTAYHTSDQEILVKFDNPQELNLERDYFAGDLIFEMDQNLVFKKALYLSEESLLMSEDKFLEKRVDEVLGEDLYAIFKDALGKSFEFGASQKVTYQLWMGNQIRDFEARIFTKNPQDRVVVVVKDITEARDINKRYEESLIELDKFFSLSLDLMGVASAEGTILKVNHAWEEIFGYSQEEIIGRSIFELIHPEDLEKLEDFFKSRPLKTYHFLNRIRDARGDYHTLEWQSAVSEGKIFALARDMTRHFEIEERLKSSEENFRTFFESVADLIFVASPEGKVLFVNESVVDKLGYSLEDIYGMHILDLHDPLDREEAEEIFADMFKGARDVCPLPLMKKNGDHLPVETRVWFGKWNNEQCIFGISKNISKEQESLQMFNKIFDSNPVLMAISEADSGKFINVNNAFVNKLGYTRNEIVGQTALNLNLFPDPAIREFMAARIRDQGYIANEAIEARTSQGETLVGLFSGEIIKTGGQEYFLTVMVDKTLQAITEKKLEKQSKVKNVLMRIATDYINIPLEKLSDAIDDSLKMMGEFVEVDRAYIFDYDYKKMTTSNTYEWCARNIEPEIDNLQGIPMEAVSNWVEQHARGGYIYYPVVDKMDDSDKTKEILESQGIKSVLTVPMMLDGHCLGFVGFDSVVAYKNYTKEDIGLLQLYAQMLVNVLNRQKQEQAIINSLEEKAVLMKEIHHRVKNNLQVISSLMFLQASYTEDATAKRVLKNSENRIKTMALLHEKIYQSNDLGRLNFKNYVESINYKLVDYYQEGLTKTVLKTDVEDISLNLDKSILAGLIINELVTNALQHAFKGRKEGEISVTAKEMGGTISLVIADDGTGISEDLKDKKTTTLGFQLVENLVNQLKGTLEIVKDGGSRFTIRFPKE